MTPNCTSNETNLNELYNSYNLNYNFDATEQLLEGDTEVVIFFLGILFFKINWIWKTPKLKQW